MHGSGEFEQDLTCEGTADTDRLPRIIILDWSLLDNACIIADTHRMPGYDNCASCACHQTSQSVN